MRARELHATTHGLADTVIAQQRRRLGGRAPPSIIDLDPTGDPTHGQQELAFFNGHCGTWCDLPVVATGAIGRRRSAAPGPGPGEPGARGV